MKTIVFKIFVVISVFMLSWTTIYSQTCIQCDENSSASGNYSSVIGLSSIATNEGAFAGGFGCEANGALSFSFGNHNIVDGTNSVAIGRFLQASSSPAMIIGTGASLSNKLINAIPQSLMIGFGSEKPTLFIGPGGPGSTGKVGIGDVTEPEAKLHLKADQDEPAIIFIEPYNFTAGESAKLRLGTMDYGVSSGFGKLFLNTGGDYIFNSQNANVGIGVLNPKHKLEVDGNIFINDDNSGLILKSPDGQCWKGRITNAGELSFELTDCDPVTATYNFPEQEGTFIKIFPNPAQNKIKIHKSGDKLMYADVLDLNGALLLTKKLETPETTISLKGMTNGYYIVRISDENNNVIANEKVVKN